MGAKMEHVISRHVQPVKTGRSYFLSQDEKYISDIINQSTANPDSRVPHKGAKFKRVLQKRFPFQTGVHGKSGKPCYGVTVIRDKTDNRLITAFPTY